MCFKCFYVLLRTDKQRKKPQLLLVKKYIHWSEVVRRRMKENLC